jgi:hypothetical protein
MICAQDYRNSEGPMDTFGEMFNEWVPWAMLTALVYYSYRNKNIRILGVIVGLICLGAVFTKYFFTTGLFDERALVVAIIVLGACAIGRQNDRA